MRPPEELREAIRRRIQPRQATPDVAEVARHITGPGGSAVQALLFFGSRKSGAAPRTSSAYDFFLLTPSYRELFRALTREGILHRSPNVSAFLNRWLPPNQIAVPARLADGTEVLAKCAVIDLVGFARETSERRGDHFLLGRLCQPTELVHTASAEAEDAVLDGVASAHALTYAWARPWLPAEFDVETYCRTFLRVSYSWEIRPEPGGRADALVAAQRDYLLAVYGPWLDALAQAGELSRTTAGFGLRHPVSVSERLRTLLYFQWSRVRATARWAKYIFTFEGWLDFILRKVHRHTGEQMVLSERERRHPLIFLWPRLFRFLRGRHPQGR